MIIITTNNISAPEFNTMAVSVFNARLAQANLITKLTDHNHNK